MDTLHAVLRSIRRETEAVEHRDHLNVFREFLAHLGRASRRKAAAEPVIKPRRRAWR